MALQIETYVRRAFPVKAVEVTDDNIYDVAKWCGGEIRTSRIPNQKAQKFIKVEVRNPLNDRQTRAFPGDWVLFAEEQFKVYTPKAFEMSFEKQVDRMFQVLERMENRAEQEEKLEFDGEDEAPSVNFSSSAS